MATPRKRITTNKSNPQQKGTYLTKENWEVMKPFVHFAVKSMAVIGSTLFALVKLFPKALEQAPPKPSPEGRASKKYLRS